MSILLFLIAEVYGISYYRTLIRKKAQHSWNHLNQVISQSYQLHIYSCTYLLVMLKIRARILWTKSPPLEFIPVPRVILLEFKTSTYNGRRNNLVHRIYVLYIHVYICLCLCMCVSWQMTTCRSVFYPSITWILWVGFRSLNFAENILMSHLTSPKLF